MDRNKGKTISTNVTILIPQRGKKLYLICKLNAKYFESRREYFYLRSSFIIKKQFTPSISTGLLIIDTL